MKKEIKVNYLDEQIDNLQNEYVEYTQQETQETEKEQEKTVKEINITSIKVVLIGSIILLIGLMIGLGVMKASQDNSIQEQIQNIDNSTKQINYLSGIILKAQKGIIVENKNIDNARKILKSKNIDYLK